MQATRVACFFLPLQWDAVCHRGSQVAWWAGFVENLRGLASSLTGRLSSFSDLTTTNVSQAATALPGSEGAGQEVEE